MPAGNRPTPHQPARVVAAARDIIAAAGYPAADRLAMRLLVTQWAARSGLPPLMWPALPAAADDEAVYQARRHLAGLVMDGWDMCDLGAAYEHLLNPGRRAAQASYYTHPVAAAVMVRFSIGLAVDRMIASPDPRAILQVLAVDPTCGAGVFLVEAARFISSAYAGRLLGPT